MGTWWKCSLPEISLPFGVRMNSICSNLLTLFPSYVGNRLIWYSVLLATLMQQDLNINKPCWLKIIPDFLAVFSFVVEASFELPKMNSDKRSCIYKRWRRLLQSSQAPLEGSKDPGSSAGEAAEEPLGKIVVSYYLIEVVWGHDQKYQHLGFCAQTVLGIELSG